MAGRGGKPLVWLKGEVKTPPFTQTARLEVGYLLRLLQEGESRTSALTAHAGYWRTVP
jgi:hypothetical protein